MNLKNLIAERDALNRKIAALKAGRIVVGCTVKIKGAAKLPDNFVNREVAGYGGVGPFINFIVTKKIGNTLYVKDPAGWNDFRTTKVNVKHVFGVKFDGIKV